MLMTATLAPLDSIATLRRRGQGDHDRLVEVRDTASREHLRRRVRAEFREMPGLRLTLGQATRLFGLREDICGRILRELIAEGLLWRAPDDRFALRSAS